MTLVDESVPAPTTNRIALAFEAWAASAEGQIFLKHGSREALARVAFASGALAGAGIDITTVFTKDNP